MTTEDSRAQYLASGATEGGESHERLDLIRDVLSTDATWAEPPPQVADGLLAALAVEAIPGPAMNQQRSGRWALVLAGAGGLVAIAALVLGTMNVIQDEGDNVVAMSGTELEAAALGEAEFGPNEAGMVDPPRCHRSSPGARRQLLRGLGLERRGRGSEHWHLPFAG